MLLYKDKSNQQTGVWQQQEATLASVIIEEARLVTAYKHQNKSTLRFQWQKKPFHFDLTHNRINILSKNSNNMWYDVISRLRGYWHFVNIRGSDHRQTNYASTKLIHMLVLSLFRRFQQEKNSTSIRFLLQWFSVIMTVKMLATEFYRTETRYHRNWRCLGSVCKRFQNISNLPRRSLWALRHEQKHWNIPIKTLTGRLPKKLMK